jgi:RNA polymerase sigma-70 factor (ECF subfamily)
MSDGIDDHGLIEAARAGQTEAFGLLVLRYQDRLYPTILRLTGGAEDAHDVLQETFLRAYSKLGRFQGESSFYTWLYRIAVNLALSFRRKNRLFLRLGDGSAARDLEVVDPGEHDPSLPLERLERDALIQRALNGLAPDHRAVVILKEFDGLSYEEIAAILRIPVGTVRSRLHRARTDLRGRLHSLVDSEASLRPGACGDA